MCDVKDVVDFFVSDGPSEHWNNKKSNKSRGKIFGKTYEVVVVLSSGKRMRDCATFVANGAGRDVFFLQELPLVLKMYSEMEYDSNEKEFGVLQRFYDRLSNHLPYPVKHKRQELIGHFNQRLQVDMLMVEKVGGPLNKRAAALNQMPEDHIQHEIRTWVCDIVELSEKCRDAGLLWYHDLHGGNIVWNDQTARWYLIDLDLTGATSYPTFEKQWHEVAKKWLHQVAPSLGRAGYHLGHIARNYLHSSGHNTPKTISADLLRGLLGLNVVWILVCEACHNYWLTKTAQVARRSATDMVRSETTPSVPAGSTGPPIEEPFVSWSGLFFYEF